MPPKLADCGVEASVIPTMAKEAAKQWTATFNPRPISADDFVKLYQDAFEGRSK